MDSQGQLIIARKAYFCCGVGGNTETGPKEGSNYTLELYIEGSINQHTGLVVNLTEIKEKLQEVIALVDHKHLAFDLDEFKKTPPNFLNLAEFFYQKIEKSVSRFKFEVYKVRLVKGESAWVDIYKS